MASLDDNDDDELFALAHQAAEELNLHHHNVFANQQQSAPATTLAPEQADALLQEALRDIDALGGSSAPDTGHHQQPQHSSASAHASNAPVANDDDDNVVLPDLSPMEALQKFQQMWLNEYLCPEMMPHNDTVYETMQVYLDVLQSNIQTLKSQPDKQRHATRIHTLRMEVSRIRYIVASYTQIRIRKIEQQAYYLVSGEITDEQRNTLLSQEERDYLRAFRRISNTLIESQFRLEVSSQFEVCREYLRNTRPASTFDNQYVFVRMLRDCPGVVVDRSLNASGNSGISDLERGQQYLIPYAVVRDLILNGSAELT